MSSGCGPAAGSGDVERRFHASGHFDMRLPSKRADKLFPCAGCSGCGARKRGRRHREVTAQLLDYRVTVVDPLLTFSRDAGSNGILRSMDFGRLPETARRFCVVASMGRFDEEAIEQALT